MPVTCTRWMDQAGRVDDQLALGKLRQRGHAEEDALLAKTLQEHLSHLREGHAEPAEADKPQPSAPGAGGSSLSREAAHHPAKKTLPATTHE